MALIFCEIPVDIIEIVIKYTNCDTYFLLRDLNFTFTKKLCHSSIESRILYTLKEKRLWGYNSIYRCVLYFNKIPIEHNEYDRPYFINELNEMVWRKLGNRYRKSDLPCAIFANGERHWSEEHNIYKTMPCSFRNAKYDLPMWINFLTGLCIWEEGKRNPVESRLTI